MKLRWRERFSKFLRKRVYPYELARIQLSEFPDTYPSTIHANRLGIAATLRLYLLGRTTNDAIMDGDFDAQSRATGEVRRLNYLNDRDDCIQAFLCELFGPYDCPTDNFTINSGHHATMEEVEQLRRMIVFLESEQKYRWPLRTRGCGLIFADIVTLGLTRQIWPYIKPQEGEEDVWPFFTREEFEAATKTSPVPPTVVDVDQAQVGVRT